VSRIPPHKQAAPCVTRKRYHSPHTRTTGETHSWKILPGEQIAVPRLIRDLAAQSNRQLWINTLLSSPPHPGPPTSTSETHQSKQLRWDPRLATTGWEQLLLTVATLQDQPKYKSTEKPLSLPMAGGWNEMFYKVPFQPKPFYNFVSTDVC